MRLSLHPEADDPGAQREADTDGDHRPAGRVDRLEIETVTRVPKEMPNAVAKVKKEGERPSQQQEKPQPRGKKAMERCVGRRSRRRCNQPANEQGRADAERDAGQTMRDREDRGELGPVNLKVGRKRSIFAAIELTPPLDDHFLIEAIALPGFSPFGQVRVQLRIVWQRYSRNGSSRLSRRSPVASSRLSASQRQACRSTAGPRKRLPFHQWLGHPDVQQKHRIHAAGPLPSSTVQRLGLFGTLQALALGRGRVRLKPRLDQGVLRIKMRQVGHQILDHP